MLEAFCMANPCLPFFGGRRNGYAAWVDYIGRDVQATKAARTPFDSFGCHSVMMPHALPRNATVTFLRF
jgi:hypothetical protein